MAQMTPVSDAEAASGSKGNSRNNWKSAAWLGVGAIVGYLASGMREGLSEIDFFSGDASSSRNQSLKNGTR